VSVGAHCAGSRASELPRFTRRPTCTRPHDRRRTCGSIHSRPRWRTLLSRGGAPSGRAHFPNEALSERERERRPGTARLMVMRLRAYCVWKWNPKSVAGVFRLIPFSVSGTPHRPASAGGGLAVSLARRRSRGSAQREERGGRRRERSVSETVSATCFMWRLTRLSQGNFSWVTSPVRQHLTRPVCCLLSFSSTNHHWPLLPPRSDSSLPLLFGAQIALR
jgi:hypothetical protein